MRILAVLGVVATAVAGCSNGDGSSTSDPTANSTAAPSTTSSTVARREYDFNAVSQLVKVLLMQLREGDCGDGNQVLSQDAIERMVVDRVATSYDGVAGPGERGYGLGWWVDRDTGLVNSAGAYGATPALQLDEAYAFYLVLEANETIWRAIFEPVAVSIEAAVLAARQ